MTAQVRALIAEFLGAFFLLFIGGLALLSGGAAVPDAGLLVVAFGFGLALLAGLYAFGEVSGGHYNPAVSLAALLDGRIDGATFIQYLVAQIAGAVAAGLALLWASSQEMVAATATIPGPGVGLDSALLLEVLMTAILVSVFLFVTASAANSVNAFAAIALTYVVIQLAIAPLTGASVNPARTLGSAIVGNTYTDVWIYLTAPFVGSAIGWGMFQIVAPRPPEPAAVTRTEVEVTTYT
jgi:aquaporin Z